MSAISLTNFMQAQLLALHEMIVNEKDPINQSALSLSFNLLLDRALAAVLREMLEELDVNLNSEISALSILTLMEKIDIPSWYISTIRNGMLEHGHWLNDWQAEMFSFNQENVAQESNNLIDVVLIGSSKSLKQTVFLTGFSKLVSEFRSMNEYC